MREVIVVGASHAGVGVVDALRRAGFAGAITLIDRLRGLPMERPPLSKVFLLGTPAVGPDSDAGDAAYLLRKPDWYAANDITFIGGTEVTAIDPAGRIITLGDGQTRAYDALVLATGASPRLLPAAAGMDGVHVLRSPDDASRLRAAMQHAKTAIVIGGGYIGLEAAASLRKAGCEVHVIEMAERLLARVASPEVSRFFHELHTSNGVHVHLGMGVKTIASDAGQFTGVTLADVTGSDGTGSDGTGSGETMLPAELLLVGIGVSPEMTLAEIAGIACGNGVLVGPDMQTNCPGIYAVGDVALAEALAPQIKGTAIRVESVHNAQDSAARAAAAITNSVMPAAQAPWFWSEQYGTRLQSAGIVPPAEATVQQVVRPGKREGGQSVWSFDGAQLCAIEAMSDPAGYMLGKKCLDLGRSPRPEDVADVNFDLKAFVAG